MRSRFLILALLLMLSLGSIKQILACSCIPTSPCQKYQHADVVFVGKVVEIKQMAENAFAVVFEVSEAFKGVKVGEKIIILSVQNAGGGCGYRFEANQISLVYAKNGKNFSGVEGLWTYQCSGNSPFEYAEESLIFLRTFLSEDSGAMIVGNIKNLVETSTFSVKGIKIKARQINRKKVFYGITDQNGSYKIEVPVGTYVVSPELPKGFIFGEINSKPSKTLKVEKRKCNGKFFIFKDAAN